MLRKPTTSIYSNYFNYSVPVILKQKCGSTVSLPKKAIKGI